MAAINVRNGIKRSLHAAFLALGEGPMSSGDLGMQVGRNQADQLILTPVRKIIKINRTTQIGSRQPCKQLVGGAKHETVYENSMRPIQRSHAALHNVIEGLR